MCFCALYVCVSSSVLTSYSRQLYETVADLLQWSDQILLDGDSATVDSQRATDIINSITCAVNVSSCSVQGVYMYYENRTRSTQKEKEKNKKCIKKMKKK